MAASRLSFALKSGTSRGEEGRNSDICQGRRFRDLRPRESDHACDTVVPHPRCSCQPGSTSHFGTVLCAVVSHAQTGPAINTRAAFINPLPPKLAATIGDESIRRFRINIPEEQLADLHRRITVTRWPERELVSDATQGVQLATMQKLAHHWATDYKWRKVEAKLNAFRQFVTTIDGLDSHLRKSKSLGKEVHQ